ncbi:MAG: DUF1684 domain-containing protein [candidate division KSB1 bacterium]|nr:DUF1684 domain-containing protein [candidate division KSB1 bacterium]MDZ7345188.1 DUF1684 domain-containing protein [candidate division KSB1 bacterium]
MKRSRSTVILFILIFAALLFSDDYVQSVEAWRQQRINNLKRPDGWLSLIGLFWLREGENSFGSDSGNDLVFPDDKADPFLGVFILNDGAVTVRAATGADIRCHGERVSTLPLIADDGEPTILTHRSLLFYVIKRGDRFGIRLKDTESDLLKRFKGIDCYPIDPSWAIPARFQPYDSGKTIHVVNALGQTTREACPGALIFVRNGQEYRLDIVGQGESEYFIVFGDATNGESTYGGGRFLYVPRPDAEGKTVIDFNKSYNPPCVFTPYATCPLPPPQNILPFPVTAGEKMFEGGHH